MRRRTYAFGTALAAVVLVSSLGGASGAVPSPLPDLKPVSVSVSVVKRPAGSVLEIRDGIKNVGRSSARRSAVRYLLSRDRRRSRGDVGLVGGRRAGRLRPGRKSRGRTRVGIPADTLPASYFVLACADARRGVRESRERNNCRPTPRRLAVTARPSPPSDPPTPPAGDSGEDPPPDPPPPPPPPLVAAAGDIACDPTDAAYNDGEGTATECRQKHVSNLLTGADVVLPLGDNQYEEATLAQFNTVFGPTWGRFKSIMRPAIGNHEYWTAGAAGYFDYFNGVGKASGPAGERGKGYYSFDVGAWHLVALNSNCSQVACAAGSPQETWLRADLAAHPASCTLAFWHHPRFSSALSENMHWAEERSVSPLWKALADAGAELVLTGHAHQYERFAPQALDPVDPENADGVPNPNGLRQFVVGTGGEEHHPFGTGGTYATSEVRDATHFGVLEVVLRPGSYEWDFVGEDGASLDDGSATCH